MAKREEAYKFLAGLQQELNSCLPDAKAMKDSIPQIIEEWNAAKSPMKNAENIFLYHYTLPKIFQYLQTIKGIGPDEAGQSILCEYYGCTSFASENAYREPGYPFPKNRGINTSEIMKKWRATPGSYPLYQAYPDLGISSPCPHKIIFEAKYFAANSQEAAHKALVDGVYEAAFYRGLPCTQSRKDGGPGWNYDFGCLLAYDASDEGILKSAWQSVAAKSVFWEGANVFVMIIRGSA